MSYDCVTSFSPRGYELYGRRFLESWIKHWPAEARLYVHHEGQKPFEDDPRIIYLDLNEDHDLDAFVLRHVNRSERHGYIEGRYNYRFDAVKFSKKVFALTGTPFERHWLIWLDADIETHSPVTYDFLRDVCPQGFTASYLGRKDWHHSELGWCAYSRLYGAQRFLNRFRQMYEGDEVFSLQEWHDSFVWDFVRREIEDDEHWFYNLSQTANGLDVWNQTPLSRTMFHNKGPQAKLKAYGAHV